MPDNNNFVVLDRFLKAMSGEWVVTRYSVDEDGPGTGKLRIHYRSVMCPDLEWSHTPHNSLATSPKIGDVGMLGFISKRIADQIRAEGDT